MNIHAAESDSGAFCKGEQAKKKYPPYCTLKKYESEQAMGNISNRRTMSWMKGCSFELNLNAFMYEWYYSLYNVCF